MADQTLSPPEPEIGSEPPTAPPTTAGAPLAGSKPPPSIRRTIAIYVGLAVLIVGATIGLSHRLGAAKGVDQTIVIPAGTADRLSAGEDVNIIPADLRLQLRDRLVVVNNDAVAHTIGPFTIPSGQRLVKRLSDVASFSGFCSLHPSGNVSVEIAST